MPISPRKINLFVMMKLPSAFICGVRVNEITSDKCVVSVKHKWINQNPFNSMYFAVQAMAAELTTGVLVMSEIKNSGKNISMLVGSSRSTFSKKAIGRITFQCIQGNSVIDAVNRSIKTGEGQALSLTSIGTNEQGEIVSEMIFEWQLKVKSAR